MPPDSRGSYRAAGQMSATGQLHYFHRSQMNVEFLDHRALCGEVVRGVLDASRQGPMHDVCERGYAALPRN